MSAVEVKKMDTALILYHLWKVSMSYSVSNNGIKMTRGDTAIFRISVDYLATGNPYEPEEGDRIRFTIKKYLSDRSALLVKDVPTDKLLLHIDSEDTAGLSFGRYYYDIQLIKGDGEIDTFISDILELTKEVG